MQDHQGYRQVQHGGEGQEDLHGSLRGPGKTFFVSGLRVESIHY